MTGKALKYLSDILRAIEFIEDFTKSSLNYEEYLNDLKTQSAGERQPGIIGEAVNKFDLLNPGGSLENSKQTDTHLRYHGLINGLGHYCLLINVKKYQTQIATAHRQGLARPLQAGTAP